MCKLRSFTGSLTGAPRFYLFSLKILRPRRSDYREKSRHCSSFFSKKVSAVGWRRHEQKEGLGPGHMSSSIRYRWSLASESGFLNSSTIIPIICMNSFTFRPINSSTRSISESHYNINKSLIYLSSGRCMPCRYCRSKGKVLKCVLRYNPC